MINRETLCSKLPDGLVTTVEFETGATITNIRPRGGGGASRDGAELELRWPDGRTERAYMNYDVLKAGAGDDAAFLREVAILEALSGHFNDAGVRVARFIAAIPEKRALIGQFVGGEANFNALTKPDDRLAVAIDFMDQLARLHRIDIDAAPVKGMGPVLPVSDLIRERIAILEARNSGVSWDPLLQLCIDWLHDNIPDVLPEPVIVHGDAGPANFLYADGKVTALLDWELVHYGDPMADLAMIALRSLFQPFVSFPAAFAAYEAAGGYPVDLARVRYWRLLFQTGFASAARYNDPEAPPPPNLGMNLVYTTIHRRVLSEALAEAAGLELDPVLLPDAAAGPRHRSFDLALDDIREIIVPRLTDQQAAVKAKGLARLIKWWRDIERFEPDFLEMGRKEIGAALNTDFADHEAAWAAYCIAVKAGLLDRSTAIHLINAHVSREAALMADAMGGLSKTRFAPLD